MSRADTGALPGLSCRPSEQLLPMRQRSDSLGSSWHGTCSVECPKRIGSRSNRMSSSQTPIRKIPHIVLLRTRGLLNMLYTLPELAAELRMPAATLRDWTLVGLPHTHDARAHIWINGVEFANWVYEMRNSRPVLHLRANEAYCLHCRRAVEIVNPQESRAGNQRILTGRCPVCNSALSKGVCDDLSS